MGESFEIESKTIQSGFKCTLNIAEWMKKDDSMEDWTIPLTEIPAARTLKLAGTGDSGITPEEGGSRSSVFSPF